MNRTTPRGCTYAVAVDADASAEEVVALAAYLSTLSPANCEVLILDDSPAPRFEENRRVLRWVGRHVAVDARVDPLRAAVELATTEKVIVASAEMRCLASEVEQICSMLDRFEVVEPDEYVTPADWCSGIEAGRILFHRGLEQAGQMRSTLAIRRSAWRPLFDFEERSGEMQLRRLIAHGTASHGTHDVFVRREPPRPARWLTRRVREAAADFSLPLKTAMFLGVLPLLLVIALVSGTATAGGYAGILGFVSMLLALKGRAGAARVFPLHACLFAPLWVAERSVTVYWALLGKMRAPRRTAARASVGTDAPRIAGTR